IAWDGGLTADPISADAPDPCGSWPAGDGGLTDGLFLWMYGNPFGSWPASDGGLLVDITLNDPSHSRGDERRHPKRARTFNFLRPHTGTIKRVPGALTPLVFHLCR